MCKSLMPEPLSIATASRPFQSSHWLPSRKTPPLVATVGLPERHFGPWASGYLLRSVIGTDWL